MSNPVGCVILAAGASRRLGHPKQLLVHRGQPLVVSAVECALQSQASACAIVIGAHASRVRAALATAPIEVLENERFDEGVAASIRVAVAWAKARACQALLLALCDQPKLTSQHLDRLIAAYEHRHMLTASRYSGKNAVPALFPQAYFDDLAALRGDRGASALLNGSAPVSPVPWPDGELDVDDAEAERRLRANRFDLTVR